MGIHDEAKLDVKFTDFAKLMNIYLNHFPKHEKYGLSQAAKKGALQSVISILGHAKNTGSLRHLLTTLKENHHDLFNRLPSRCHARSHAHTAPA